MRIISEFRDYYDTAQAHGLDPALLYFRKPQFHRLDLRFWTGTRQVLPYEFRARWGLPSPVRSVTIGFCGSHFSAWIDSSVEFSLLRLASRIPEKRWFTLEEAIEADANFERAHARDWRLEEDVVAARRKITEHARRIQSSPEDLKPFLHFDCPIYVMATLGGGWSHPPNSVEVVTNPRLANFGFEKVRDPFSAFQAIATFLSNELARSEDGPQTVGGDEVVARSKGFDEMSFRTMAPGKKKLNRKENRQRKGADPPG